MFVKMTKTFMQLFVENMLKVLKVLKTRTALTRNGLAELRMRYARQSAKALFKTKEQNRVTTLHKQQNAKKAKHNVAQATKHY